MADRLPGFQALPVQRMAVQAWQGLQISRHRVAQGDGIARADTDALQPARIVAFADRCQQRHAGWRCPIHQGARQCQVQQAAFAVFGQAGNVVNDVVHGSGFRFRRGDQACSSAGERAVSQCSNSMAFSGLLNR